MNKNIKVNAAILIIGNEILSGRTQDTNTSTLATWLNSIGVKVGEVRVIPDLEKTIVDTLKFLKSSYDYVFTTGGIGPTHDDITTEAVAAAFFVPVIRNPEAERRLIAHYANTGLEFNAARQKMADVSRDLAANCFGEQAVVSAYLRAVSYTHLTLPTILLV